GTITYTPDEDFNGTDTFTYTVSDGAGGTDTATVTVTVGAVNDDPVAVDDDDTTDEDQAVIVDVVGNDSDVDGDPLSVIAVGAAGNGGVVDNGDGTLTYTPDDDFNGTDTFTYTVSDGAGGTDTATVTVTVGAVNDDPVAVDDNDTTDEDQAITFGVLGNDSDVDGDDFFVLSVGEAANGTVNVGDIGGEGVDSVTYTPDEDFVGSDTFTYTISDGNGGTDTATVTVNVGAVNDDPVAVDDADDTNEEQEIIISVLDNDEDVDGDDFFILSVGEAGNGTVEIVTLEGESDGTISYTPDAEFNGQDTFTYTISDGNGGTDTATVTVNVGAVNDDPVVDDQAFNIAEESESGDAVGTVVASDVDGPPLTYSITAGNALGLFAIDAATGAITLAQDVDDDEVASYDLTVLVSDGIGGSDTATVTVTIDPVNDDPVVDDQAFNIAEESLTGAAVGTVVASDVDGPPLTYSITAGNALGLFAIDAATGAITLAADVDDDEVGDHALTVLVLDGIGGTDTATVTVTVDPVNDDPVGVPVISGEAEEDSVLTADASGISDADGLGAFSYQWQVFDDGVWVDIAGATDDTFTPGDGEVGLPVRVKVSYTDGGGTEETVASDQTDPIADGGEIDVVVVDGEVFIQGTFVELGVAAAGTLGTTGAAPESFVASNQPGLDGLSFYAGSTPLADLGETET
ncbi:MAG: tandem-95 repeat protein, partial [bacterium]|nr:tandem-95 repeat protein [bacterium]